MVRKNLIVGQYRISERIFRFHSKEISHQEAKRLGKTENSRSCSKWRLSSHWEVWEFAFCLEGYILGYFLHLGNIVDVNWERSWFIYVPMYPKAYWDNPSNQRSFLDSLAEKYHLKNSSDWQRLTVTLVRRKGGSVSSVSYKY